MPQTIETTVYRLGELDADARDAARAWYRETGFDDDWHEFVFADFETVCTILGIDLATSPVRLMGGGTRPKPHIWFRGFWSQGDGACFEGSYAYARDATRRIRAYAPADAELHAIADALQAVQRRNFYQIRAEISHQGRYYHEYSMTIAVERDSPTWQDITVGADEIVAEAQRDLARWLYRQLEREYDHLTSDAAVDEAMVANDYTFTTVGRRFGRQQESAQPDGRALFSWSGNERKRPAGTGRVRAVRERAPPARNHCSPETRHVRSFHPTGAHVRALRRRCPGGVRCARRAERRPA